MVSLQCTVLGEEWRALLDRRSPFVAVKPHSNPPTHIARITVYVRQPNVVPQMHFLKWTISSVCVDRNILAAFLEHQARLIIVLQKCKVESKKRQESNVDMWEAESSLDISAPIALRPLSDIQWKENGLGAAMDRCVIILYNRNLQ